MSSIWTDPLPAPAAASDPFLASLIADAARLTWFGEFPVHRAPAGTPTVPVTFPNAQLTAAFADTPLPPEMTESTSSDHVGLILSDDGRYYEVWQLRQAPDGTWHGAWGGAAQDYDFLLGQGSFTPQSWPGLSTYRWGTSASSIPVAPGLIRPEEIVKGGVERIDHLLTFSVPDAHPGVFSWPAQRTDGLHGQVPYGTRFRLDPAFDVSTIHSRPARIIATALQHYGMVVRDKTWAACTFHLQAPAQGDAPWTDQSLLGPHYAQVTASIPWQALERVPADVRSISGPAPGQ